MTFSILKGTACQTSLNIIEVEFTYQFGSLRPLVAVVDHTMSVHGGYVVVSGDGVTSFTDAASTTLVSIKGTKENDTCSNRGLCDTSDGVCSCFDTNGDAYGSSNGYGSAGTRGDCGYILSSTDSVVSSCPGEIQCSAHGVCSSSTYRCDCYEGWSGGDCSLRTCPSGLSWFDYPTRDQFAHRTYTECSDMGLCDQSTGQCQCRDGFYGQACEMMSCDGENPTIRKCGGHGRCMSMSELAVLALDNGDATSYTYGTDPNNALTWDGSRVHGCLCDEGYEGYDCSLRSCARGDDPGTYNDHPEIQLIKCIADEGSFTLTFREYTTSPILHNATSADVEAALIALPSIASSISVYFSMDMLPSNATLSTNEKPARSLPDGFPSWSVFSVNESVVSATSVSSIWTNSTGACSSTDSTQIIIIYFQTLVGDLPRVTADISSLFLSSTGENGYLTIYTDGSSVQGRSPNSTVVLRSVRGTTENDVCNNRGLCDYSTGICQCFPTWSSSDGMGGPGNRGDCGYRNDHLYSNFNSVSLS